MPHFLIEYSANLEDHVDIDGLVRHVHQAALASGVFPLKGTRTRAVARHAYCIADAHPDNAFIHATARIGSGRSLAVRQAAGRQVFDAMVAYLQSLVAARPVALSFEMVEIEPHTSFKMNNLPKWIEQRAAERAS